MELDDAKPEAANLETSTNICQSPCGKLPAPDICLVITHVNKIMSFIITNIYTSASANDLPGCVDWNSSNTICYGSANAILIYDNSIPNSPRITQSLVQHQARVNAVKWISKEGFLSSALISGSFDRTAVFWRIESDKYIPQAILKGHTDAVMIVDGSYGNDNKLILVTGSVDSSIKIWTDEKDNFQCVQTIDLHNGLCLALRIFTLPNGETLLAIALDSCKVHLFTWISNQFVKILTVSGHEDWVRGLDFTIDDNGRVLIATCSQDTYVRIWSLSPNKNKTKESSGIETEKTLIKLGDELWTWSLEAVLSGHEGWIYSVKWHPSIKDANGDNTQPMKLLSASIDKTMIIWQLENEAWVENVRVGEVGGNGLGFYGGTFGPDGKSIMGHGYTGSFHIWTLTKDGSWGPAVVCGGHFREVIDVGWEPENGLFLVSIGTDQTTRIHAPWKSGDKSSVSWHEIARPQVHGYDMTALAILSKYKFVSGAEEKVIRAFEAPHIFLQNLKNISKVDVDEETARFQDLPYGASVPSLGLSNKAVYDNETKNIPIGDGEQYFTPAILNMPPTEETLMENTLWPEIKKLYGHGYEIFTLAANKDGTLVASACKATTQQHASIIIWDTVTWTQLQSLTSHQLTVTQLEFSPDGSRLLSVSRDRRFSVFEQSNDNRTFNLVSASDKTNGIHSRIIWCCAWTHDSRYFATGSRDGKVAVWTEGDVVSNTSLKKYKSAGVLGVPSESITALAFSPFYLSEHVYMMATGTEKGSISIYKVTLKIPEFHLLAAVDTMESHHLTVRRLRFRPVSDESNGKRRNVQLASCGNDIAVKIFEVLASDE